MRRRLLLGEEEKMIEVVDMGLSVDWAICNIGAESPEEYGWYFQWAGITAYNSDRTPVEGGSAISFDLNSNCPYYVRYYAGRPQWSKYTVQDNHSPTLTADNKHVLEPIDDAAHVHWGGKWRMPTYEEYNELLNACNKTWVENYNGTGINGELFTLKSDSSKTLFFPAAGYISLETLGMVGYSGDYWMSSIHSTYSEYGRNLTFSSVDCYLNSYFRSHGYTVRAVKPK